jgi:hypothetical protein
MDVEIYFLWKDNLLVKAAIVCATPSSWEYLKYSHIPEHGVKYFKVYTTSLQFDLEDISAASSLLGYIEASNINCFIRINANFQKHSDAIL